MLLSAGLTGCAGRVGIMNSTQVISTALFPLPLCWALPKVEVPMEGVELQGRAVLARHSETKFSAIITLCCQESPESPICQAISARSRRREVRTVLSFQNVPIGLEKCLWLCTPPNLFSLVNGWIFLCWKVWMYVLFLSPT